MSRRRMVCSPRLRTADCSPCAQIQQVGRRSPSGSAVELRCNDAAGWRCASSRAGRSALWIKGQQAGWRSLHLTSWGSGNIRCILRKSSANVNVLVKAVRLRSRHFEWRREHFQHVRQCVTNVYEWKTTVSFFKKDVTPVTRLSLWRWAPSDTT